MSQRSMTAALVQCFILRPSRICSWPGIFIGLRALPGPMPEAAIIAFQMCSWHLTYDLLGLAHKARQGPWPTSPLFPPHVPCAPDTPNASPHSRYSGSFTVLEICFACAYLEGSGHHHAHLLSLAPLPPNTFTCWTHSLLSKFILTLQV